jgi:hypothetical protein
MVVSTIPGRPFIEKRGNSREIVVMVLAVCAPEERPQISLIRSSPGQIGKKYLAKDLRGVHGPAHKAEKFVRRNCLAGKWRLPSHATPASKINIASRTGSSQTAAKTSKLLKIGSCFYFGLP